MILSTIKLAILSGVCFGTWPLFLNKSGLSGNASAFVYTFLCLLVLFPFAISEMKNIGNTNWLMMIAAAVIGAMGVKFFSGMLAVTTAKDTSLMFIVMICVQISVPAIYNIYLERGISPMRGLGLALAFAAAIVLTLSREG